jgi:hypothetical protein
VDCYKLFCSVSKFLITNIIFFHNYNIIKYIYFINLRSINRCHLVKLKTAYTDFIHLTNKPSYGIYRSILLRQSPTVNLSHPLYPQLGGKVAPFYSPPSDLHHQCYKTSLSPKLLSTYNPSSSLSL